MSETPPPSSPTPNEGEARSPASAPESTAGEGFSTTEQLLGAAAVYKAPLVSSVVASALLRDEADPVRRRQLTQFRTAAIVWLAVGAFAFLIGLIVVLSVGSSASGAGGKCKEGPEPLNALGTSYYSSDNVHWTATVPCFGGGYTDVPVPAGEVP